MHQQDFSADSPGSGSRKAAFHYRRGSSGASVSATGSGGVGAVDDTPNQAGSSSPGPHHQPQSQVTGTQVKKKSGFQITSVTSAQINVSGNNSLADDTESYDDMDESHTEDLSSSDMLDVSVSRATDTGVPERSSSDETLNSLHGVDTPGLVSPNEPLHPHSIHQGSQQQASMVNGTVHPHHYYSQQHGQSHHQRSDSLSGAEPSLPALPVVPLASSSPAMTSKAVSNLSQRPPVLDNTKPAGVTTQVLAPSVGVAAPDQGIKSTSNVTAAPESTSVSGQVASVGGGTGPSAAPANIQHSQTQTATGSRFRVVKLDTNSEPFRKGRWTCTEYYEKEIPHPTTSDAPKGAEVSAETEANNVGIGPGIPVAQPPHILHPYQPPSQDFTSPQAMQSPPQGLAQTTPLTYVSTQDVVIGAHMPKSTASVPLPTATPQVIPPSAVSQPQPLIPQQLPYVVDPHQTQPHGVYPATQLHAGVIPPGSVRQPDFIQPTAPFQTQVQPPLPHVTTGIPIAPVPGVLAQPPASITQQLGHQGSIAPLAQASFPAGQPLTLPIQAQPHPQPHVQPSSTATVPVASSHGIPYMPLTALQADLKPILAPGATLTHVPGVGSTIKPSQLEDAQKLLLQHQGLLGLPRLTVAVSGESPAEASSGAGTLAHIGISAEASAFMAAAAAGLRSQHGEGEDDSSSGASVVAIDNKIEQAMDLVKSHLMYAVREEVEVLKEQIKELIERNSQLEQENNLLKTLASPEQMAQFQAQVQTSGSPTSTTQTPALVGSTQGLPSTQSSGPSA
ncbi:TSC22 domain family protein 1 isoform X1 [Betta splendens]|uniref:TSC22 domain family protein 1 n=1 Tax=Betta splendens TaxID=158456 RepID=A0A6P7KSK2_BETSP|nr:TSC22 domain family protein 1 isoform X1 [Betta splendens]